MSFSGMNSAQAEDLKNKQECQFQQQLLESVAVKDKTKIEPSPKILEQLKFGFTDSNLVDKIKGGIEGISVDGVELINLDMVFGLVQVSLPNPSVNYWEYFKARVSFTKELKKVLDSVA